MNPKNLKRNYSYKHQRGQVPLPDWIDKLTHQPWNPTASLLVDRWLWYCQQEFEVKGGSK